MRTVHVGAGFQLWTMLSVVRMERNSASRWRPEPRTRANFDATEGQLGSIEYEALTGGWRGGWTKDEHVNITEPSPARAQITSATTASFGFNSC